MTTRRHFLLIGGGILAALGQPRAVRAGQVVIVEMRGTARGEHVWFVPNGLAVPAGTTVRFFNNDRGNSHTATAYHPDIYGRARRIPGRAVPWDSDFLLPSESFEVTLTTPGVYDYYCIPHEKAGMVGRIVVGHPDDPDWAAPAPDSDDLDPKILVEFPSVADIVSAGRTQKGGTP